MQLCDLVGAVAMHREYPNFYTPPPERLDRLQSGDVVKICRHSERFWVLVSDTFGSFITGTVNNALIEPDNADLLVGTPVLLGSVGTSMT